MKKHGPEKSEELPDYLDQPPEIRSYFDELKGRQVILEVDKLSREFQSNTGPVHALDDISLTVHHREFISIVGPSGCGKSTLIRIIAGLDQASSGSVFLDKKQITEAGPDRGVVFQNYTLFPWLTVKKNVLFGLRLSDKPRAQANKEATQWIRMVGLEEFTEAYPHELSGGMKQRVAIARALANRPRILIMDEPFGALDAQTRSQMQSYLLQIWRNFDVTIVFITHDLDEAIYLSDRVLVLGRNPGRILEIIECPVTRPRTPDQFIQPYFLATRKRLDKLIHGEFPAEADSLPFVDAIKKKLKGDLPAGNNAAS